MTNILFPRVPQRFIVSQRIAKGAGFISIGLVFVLACLLVTGGGLAGYEMTLLMRTTSFAIAALGMVVILGYTGLVSIAQAAFFGIGAYVLGLGTTDWGLGWWAAFALSIAVTALSGLLIGFTTLRVGGHYLAMVTIGFGVVVGLVLMNAVDVTHGPDGVIGIQRPLLWGSSNTEPSTYSIFCLLVLLLACTLVYFLRRSNLGRAMRAVRDDELAASVVGIRILGAKLAAFTIGSVLGGVGGALYASAFAFVSPDDFTFAASVLILTMVVIGGARYVLGGVVGAAVLILLPEVLRPLQNTYMMVFGLAVVVMVIFIPDGFVGLFHRVARRVIGPPPAIGAAVEVDPACTGPARVGHADGQITSTGSGDPVLRIRDLHKHFGGVRALQGLDLTVAGGTVHALIGPNGSGKTTVLNVLSGIYSPSEGEIEFYGTRIDGWAPHRVARLGISRTFQLIRLMESMTVLENVVVGAQAHVDRRNPQALKARAMEALDQVGLAESAYRFPGELSYGMQRRVELARAAAARPRLLLLDEPAAGLNTGEKEQMSRILRKMVDSSCLSILLIEHDMGMVKAVSDEITVLNFGAVLASGVPDEVLRDDEVVTAYLGKGANA